MPRVGWQEIGQKVDKLSALRQPSKANTNLVPSVTLLKKKADFLSQLDQFDSIVVAIKEGQPKKVNQQRIKLLQG